VSSERTQLAVVRESNHGERRVALVPKVVAAWSLTVSRWPSTAEDARLSKGHTLIGPVAPGNPHNHLSGLEHAGVRAFGLRSAQIPTERNAHGIDQAGRR
jgi:NAD/NADP transhydrogenase alpha subunit